VLFRWKGHVQVIDRFLDGDLGGIIERAEERESPVAEMVAASFVVDEPDNLIPSSRVFENLVRRRACPGRRTPRSESLRPIPARQRRSRTSRMNSRDAKVSATFKRRKMTQTGCETSSAPVSRALVTMYVSTYKVDIMPKSTARMLPTKTAKKSSTRDRPRRRR
jgi:hypothetical protein